MIGYKIAIGVSEKHGFFPVMVELEIPDDAIIINPICATDKYRTNKCKVVSVYKLIDEHQVYEDWDGNAFSIWELIEYWVCSEGIVTIVYKIGREILLNDIDTNVHEVCGSGIHFFRDKQLATEYYFDDPTEWISYYLMEFNNLKQTICAGIPQPIRSKNLMKICLDFYRGELSKDAENSRIYQ